MNRPQKLCVTGRSQSTRQHYQHAGLTVRYKDASAFRRVEHSLRPSKLTKKSKRSAQSYESPLDKYMELEKIKLAIDSSRGLISEWARTCGSPELIKVLVTRWEALRGIFLIENPPKPKSAISKRLRELGFGRDTIDKLILRIALGTTDKIIVSDESDFWDPKKPDDNRVKGDFNAPVARLCREKLDVTILLLKCLMSRLQE